MLDPFRIGGSFRDPSGSVYTVKGRVFRSVNPVAKKRYEFIRDSGLLKKVINIGYLINTWELDVQDWPKQLADAAYVLEHDLIPHISYPYEWCFSQLKLAAIHHLDFQLSLLDENAVLSDATAYNIQFIGPRPIFIDLLSIQPYQAGQYWTGHNQFCEQFLNPLLLRAIKGVPHNSWYRGALEGVSSKDLSLLLSLKDKFSWNVLSQVVLHAYLNKRALLRPDKAISKAKSKKTISRLAYRGFLIQLRTWIAKLEPKDTGKTAWSEYAANNTYRSDESEFKRSLVVDFAKRRKPKKLIDQGCNTGDYSIAAIEGGADYVLGYDFDHKAIDLAFLRAAEKNMPYLPLYLDASNTSPSQGWMQKERDGFLERNNADAVIALAFEHHLAIGKNIPLEEVVEWIVGLAPQGLIEFIPKNEITVQKMLALREDIFINYTEEKFVSHLQFRAKIVKSTKLPGSERILFEYDRR